MAGKAVMLFLGLGAATALWASKTGEALEESVEGTPIVDELVAYHGGMAKLTTYSSFAAFLIVVAFFDLVVEATSSQHPPFHRANRLSSAVIDLCRVCCWNCGLHRAHWWHHGLGNTRPVVAPDLQRTRGSVSIFKTNPTAVSSLQPFPYANARSCGWWSGSSSKRPRPLDRRLYRSRAS